jgi:hypothetical protein
MGSLARAAEHQQGLEFSQRNLCCFRLRLTGIHPERESGTAWRLRQEQKNPSWPVCQSIGKNGVFGMRTALSNYAMRVANGAVGVVAAAVVHAVSPNRAHEVFWRISQAAFPLFAGVYRVFRPQSRSELWRIHVLQRALSVMTRQRPGFTLKVRVSGTDDPLIICTAHFGLTLAAARVLADLGHRPAWIVDRTDTADGWHWGLRQPLWILPRASDVMLHARRALQDGFPVVCYVDFKPPEFCSRTFTHVHISPNVFRLAHRLAANLLFMASGLEADGTIRIEFRQPNLGRLRSLQEADLCAAEFAEFVSARTGWTCSVRKPHNRGSRVSPPVQL